jgi:hypothetical protein
MTLSGEILERKPTISPDFLLATLDAQLLHSFNLLMNHGEEHILTRVLMAVLILLEQPEEQLSSHMNC